MDTLTPEKRSALMSRIRSRDTGPELLVRKLTHGLGFRYRLHYSQLPGRPDMAFPGRRKLIFVHGCFWHGHDCSLCRTPKSNIEFWSAKIRSNRERDARVAQALADANWRALVIWECQLGDIEALKNRILEFLE